MSIIFEITIAVVSIICGIVGFYVKRLYSRVDQHGVEVSRIDNLNTRMCIQETELDSLSKTFHDHRVEDAATYPSRKEVDDKLFSLKDDLRGMIAPVRTSLQNVENYLRESKK